MISSRFKNIFKFIYKQLAKNFISLALSFVIFTSLVVIVVVILKKQDLAYANETMIETNNINRYSKLETSTLPLSPIKFSKNRKNKNISSILNNVEQEQFRDNDYEKWTRERTVRELKIIVKAIATGIEDPMKLTDLVFLSRHPELAGTTLSPYQQDLLDEWNAISALMVQPSLNEYASIFGRSKHKNHGFFDNQASNRLSQKFEDVIASSANRFPGLSPSLLKGLLAQESGFNPNVVNKYGYAGIAQIGRNEAREVGLRIGTAGSITDERLNPEKAIPAAADLLRIKADRLEEIAFSKYGRPIGDDYWKFVLAAYNGGESTVTVAMGHAYRDGLEQARTSGLIGRQSIQFARKYASKWENLRNGDLSSPLGLATSRYFPALATVKYHEIGNYPEQIFKRLTAEK